MTGQQVTFNLLEGVKNDAHHNQQRSATEENAECLSMCQVHREHDGRQDGGAVVRVVDGVDAAVDDDAAIVALNIGDDEARLEMQASLARQFFDAGFNMSVVSRDYRRLVQM